MKMNAQKIHLFCWRAVLLGGRLPILFLLFALIPIAEIALLIHVGGIIGSWNTVALVLITAALGAFFVKREGLATLQSAQAKMQQNQLPGKELMAGACLLVAGVLLITPGFMTDIFGFLLVFPPTRNRLANNLSKHFTAHSIHTSGFQSSGFYHQTTRPQDNGDVFEGEYTKRSDRPVIIEKSDDDTDNKKNL